MTVQAPIPLTLNATQSAAPSNFDLEVAVLSATLERIGLYDSQIADLMQKMKDRNSKAARYNAVLQELNKIKNAFKNDAKGNDKVDQKTVDQYKKDLEKACSEAGLTPDLSKKIDHSKRISALGATEAQATKNKEAYRKAFTEIERKMNAEPDRKKWDPTWAPTKNEFIKKYNAEQKTIENTKAELLKLRAEHNPNGGLSPATTKADVENAINRMQGLVDENNNTSQMDQLQLQSLISKRNAQFEMASTVIKKTIDGLSTLIGNMR